MGGSCQTLNKQICFFIISHSTLVRPWRIRCGTFDVHIFGKPPVPLFYGWGIKLKNHKIPYIFNLLYIFRNP